MASPDTAVLLLDLQRDFLEPTGRMPIAQHQVDALVATSNALTEAAHAHGAPVLYVNNEFPDAQWILNFLRCNAARVGTPGAALDPRIHVVSEHRFAKEQTDAFTNPALDAFLRARAVRRIVVCGVFGPACVRATVRGACARGYDVVLAREAIGAASDRARDRALNAMARDGARVVEGRAIAASFASAS
jgi:nicotinamidase-related amidase